MNNLQKRLLIILSFVVLIVGFSFYGQWQKEAVAEKTNSEVNAVITEVDNVVYVSGLVNYPGVIKVSAGSRVIDVINAAGGLAPGADMSKVNLAQPVKDGMQINVPGSPKSGVATASAAATNGKININTADKIELDKLPGVGPAMAEKIIKYRQENGVFKDIAELKKVRGIGEAKFNRLKDKVML